MSRDFQTAKMVTARKDYPCEECSKGIKKGQRYERLFQVFDGYASTARLCWRCSRSWARFFARFGDDHNDEDGPSFGQLVEFIKQIGPWTVAEIRERRRRKALYFSTRQAS